MCPLMEMSPLMSALRWHGLQYATGAGQGRVPATACYGAEIWWQAAHPECAPAEAAPEATSTTRCMDWSTLFQFLPVRFPGDSQWLASYENWTDGVQRGAQRPIPPNFRPPTKRENHPYVTSRGRVDEVRRPMIGSGTNDNPMQQRWIVFPAAAYVCEGHIARCG
jgi:hypothetical protein